MKLTIIDYYSLKMKSTTRPLSFFSNGFRLQGVLHLPQTLPAPFVVGCHGLFSDKESPKQIELGRQLSRHGLAFFRFDHRGCGESAGDLARDTSLEARCQDLMDAVHTLESLEEITRLTGLFGSSLGGTVVLATGGKLPDIKRVTLAAPLQSVPVINAIRASNDPVLEQMPTRFFETDLRFDLSDTLPALSHVLIFHGEADPVVPCQHAHTIFERCRSPKELIIQKNGDHRMSNPRHQQAFMKKAVAWLTEPLE